MANGSRVARTQRIKKRIAVRYGPAYPLLGTGFTTNVSPRGLAMSASSVFKPGTTLVLELRLPGEDLIRVGGVVAWALRGAPAMGLPSTLGVEITGADESFFRFLGKLPGFDGDRAAASASPGGSAAGSSRGVRTRADRYASELPFRFGTTSALFLTGRLLNVSASGLSFRATGRIPVGTPLHFAADWPGGSLQGTGVVLWTRTLAGEQVHGMRLTQATETWFRHLRQLSAP